MDDDRRAEARRLRVTQRLSVAELCQRLGVGRAQLAGWLDGIPPPDWTRRPNAKDDLREAAVRLRADGWPVHRIAAELGVARSTAYQWVRHLPLGTDQEQVERRRAHAKAMTDARWGGHRVAREQARSETREAARGLVGPLSEREVLLLGAVAYWSEGAKAKPWRPNDCRLKFINSDPTLIELFLRFVGLLGVARGDLRFRVSIHENADATAASRWWACRVGVSLEQFHRPTLKRHRPGTPRQNTGVEYRGCLAVEVPRSSELYWRTEGLIDGIARDGSRDRDGSV
ncbi:MAG TPA: helix-turn-helix domain-containing protein [Catenuloplanes sp.]